MVGRCLFPLFSHRLPNAWLPPLAEADNLVVYFHCSFLCLCTAHQSSRPQLMEQCYDPIQRSPKGS